MTPREWWLLFDVKMAKLDAEAAAQNKAPRFNDEERERMREMFNKGRE